MYQQIPINKDSIEQYGVDLGVEDICKIDDSALSKILRTMHLIRKMEKKLENFYDEKLIRGFCHLSIGQEAIYAALEQVLNDDKVVTSYRCHAAAFITGCSIKEIICENLGLREGNNRGKGGSMHLYNKNMFGGHGIVGAQVPLGIGIGYAIKYKEFLQSKSKNFRSVISKHVCFTLYGDGASNQGQVYESFNMAKIYNIPVVFICENNKYGMYTPLENVCVDDCFYKRGYGIPGIRVSDSDMFCLINVLRKAREYARENGPIIIQIDTNRICGHSVLDKDQFYREEETIADCLDLVEKKIKSFAKSNLVENVKNEVEGEFESMLKSIDFSDYPDSSEIYKDIVH